MTDQAAGDAGLVIDVAFSNAQEIIVQSFPSLANWVVVVFILQGIHFLFAIDERIQWLKR